MRVLLTAWLTVSSVLAYDAVVFSNEQKITRDFPTAENLLSTASAEAPLLFLVNPDFTLGQFSRAASVYSADKKASGLTAVVKDSKNHAARFLDSGVHAPGAVVVTAADDFKTGSAVYIVAGEDWTSMEALAEKILPQVGDKYTAVIAATESVSQDKARVKRVATDDMGVEGEGDTVNGSPFDMPMNIPPYNRSTAVTVDIAKLGNCMLYSEGINIVVMSDGAKGGFANIPVRSTNGTKWEYSDGDVVCANGTSGNYTFTMNMITGSELHGFVGTNDVVKIAAGTKIKFTLVIKGDRLGYWQLIDATIGDLSVQPSGTSGFLPSALSTKDGVRSKNVDYMGMQSVQGWAFGCSNTQAVFFPTGDANSKSMIGISLYNTEIQPYGVYDANRKSVYFTLNVDDCTGTFSTGSWMAIISILVMLTGFFFGYLMLNAVQTMDRFDDPKQKQILINVRE